MQPKEYIQADYEAILVSIGEGVIVIDRHQKVIFMNAAAEYMLGWKTRDFIGKTWQDDIPVVYDKDRKLLPSDALLMQKVFVSGETIATSSYFFLRKDKISFPVALTTSPLIIHKKIIGAVMIFRDITREKERGTTSDEFLHLASHQLRNPVISIKWMIELLLQTEKLTEQTKKYLTSIRTSATRLSDLVALLLNVSRIERGKVVFSSRSFDLVKFVKSFLNEYAPFSTKKNISVIFEKHPPVLRVVIDSGAFYNIIQSLVVNAIEYTPEGGTIEVSLEERNRAFRVTVRDTGIGIPKKNQRHIFEKFSRGSNARIINRGGLGLGLYAAFQTVQLLNGKIWFDSEEDKGTTFYVELPLRYTK